VSTPLKNGSGWWMSKSRSCRSERPSTTSDLNVSSQALGRTNPALRAARLLLRLSRGTSRTLVPQSWPASWLLTSRRAPWIPGLQWW
jgi:hypothetical protein